MLLDYLLITLILFPEYSKASLPPSYRVAVDLEDHKIFVIDFEGDHNEDEIIQPQDLVDIPLFNRTEDKYKPLHTHVEHYNHQTALKAIKNRKLPKNEPMSLLEEQNNDYLEPGPFVAGFQEDLDKLNFKEDESRILRELQNSTINTSTDEIQKDYQEGHTSSDLRFNNSSNGEESDEAYDYQSFKEEYEQQIQDALNSNQTYNYTDKGHPEDTPKEVVKKIFQYKKPKNCTEDELKQFGLKGFECLAFDYKHPEVRRNFKVLLSRTWTVLKIWMIIYLVFAIPCWCQKGWCCCFFRCKCCFPNTRILNAKRFYVNNPPGVLTEQPYGKENPLEFKPTVLELDAYEKLEFAIKNL